MELKGKIAIVTGASGWFGGRVALALAREGCHCICHYCSGKDRAEGIVREILASGQKALAVQADLTDLAQIEKLFAKAGDLGTPGVLINSAAIFEKVPLEQVSFEQAQKQNPKTLKA